MFPLLTYPLALLGLIAVPVLVGVYFFQNRYRKVEVSSLLLWQLHSVSKAGGREVQRPKLPLLFFLELLAILLMVIAAVGPRWQLAQMGKPLIVILDDSVSMRAVADGSTPRERALKQLERFSGDYIRSMRIILAGSRPRVLQGQFRSVNEVVAALEEWTCRAVVASIDDAIVLAGELSKEEANILVITDEQPDLERFPEGRIRWLAFGESTRNIGIVNASRSANGDVDRCFLEIANFSHLRKHKGKLVVSLKGGEVVHEENYELAPGDKQRILFSLPEKTPLVEAWIGDDSLADDNRVRLIPPARKKVRVLVGLKDEVLRGQVQEALQATGMLASISKEPHLIVHDRAEPIEAAEGVWSLRFILSEKSSVYSGPFVIDTTHPLAEGLDFTGVIWSADGNALGKGEPVIMAGNVPLIEVQTNILKQKHISCNVNLELSNIQAGLNWPIFFWNLMNWRVREMPGLLENSIRSGRDFVVNPKSEAITVRYPSGGSSVYEGIGHSLRISASEVGEYSIEDGLTVYEGVVNLLSVDESDLRFKSTGEWGTWENAEEVRLEYASFLWVFVLMAIGVLTIHMYYVVGRRSVV